MAATGCAVGIDLGTTSVKVVVLDIDSKYVLFSGCQKTDADVLSDIGELGYEQNVSKIYSAVELCVRQIPADILANVKILSFTGQMHGLVLWNKIPKHMALDDYITNTKTSNLYTWQDKRSTPEFLNSLPVPNSHIPIATGLGCVTYFWLLRYRSEMLDYDWMGTVMDYFVFSLCGLDQPVTTDQLATSMGYFNVQKSDWNTEILEQNGFPVNKLPLVVSAGHVIGKLSDDWLGIKKGVAVLAGLGDVQCSFLSALSERQNTALLNISTSLQLGCIVNGADCVISDIPSVQHFPYFNGEYLALAASLNGGNVITHFVRMITESTKQLGLTISEEDVWNKLLEGACNSTLDETLEIQPTLFGERHAPQEFGRISGLTSENMCVVKLFNSLCFGLVKNAQDMMPVKFLESNKISKIFCSGSVLSRNYVVKNHVRKLFEKFDTIDGTGCDSASGASLCAIRHSCTMGL